MERRSRLGMTQQEAAQVAGVSLATWRRFESGEGRAMAASTRKGIAKALRMSEDDLDWLLSSPESADDIPIVKFAPPSTEGWVQRFNDAFGSPLTPRQAYVLSAQAGFYADRATGFDEILAGEATADEVDPYSRLPLQVLFTVNHVWLNRFRSTFDAIADRLDKGKVPYPRCVAEEVALHFLIEDARETYEDIEYGGSFEKLDDYGSTDRDWDVLFDVLYQDSDYEVMWQSDLGWMSNADVAAMLRVSPDDYHPFNWWKSFLNADDLDR